MTPTSQTWRPFNVLLMRFRVCVPGQAVDCSTTMLDAVLEGAGRRSGMPSSIIRATVGGGHSATSFAAPVGFNGIARLLNPALNASTL
jgi:hypothetical protein